MYYSIRKVFLPFYYKIPFHSFCSLQFSEATSANSPGSTSTSVIKITREEKEAGNEEEGKDAPAPGPELSISSPKTDKDVQDDIHLLPKILRLRRKKRSPLKKSTWSCSHDAPECLSVSEVGPSQKTGVVALS